MWSERGQGGARSPGGNRKNEEVMKKKCLSLPFNHQLSQISEAPLCRCSGGGGSPNKNLSTNDGADFGLICAVRNVSQTLSDDNS